MNLRNLWQKFKRWWFERWKPWIEFYVKERKRRGVWYKYGIPAGIFLILMTVIVGNMLRFQVIPIQYRTFVAIAYILTIFILSTIVVVTSIRTMGKLSLFFLAIAVIVVSIAILAYYYFERV